MKTSHQEVQRASMSLLEWLCLVAIMSLVLITLVIWKPMENSLVTFSPGFRHEINLGVHRDMVTVTNIKSLHATTWAEMPVTAEPIMLLDEVEVGDVIEVRSLNLHHVNGYTPQDDSILVGSRLKKK